MRAFVVSALLLLAAAPAFAQAAGGAAPSNVASVKWTHDMVKGYITRAAQMMPEEHYAFQPTPEVRTFGKLVAHIANANYMICSTAKGEANPNKTDFETVNGKAALVKAVTDSFVYCDGAFALTDAQASAAVSLFGNSVTKAGALAFNAAHDFEHYGNIVTYMRMKGLVPPSSAGGS